MIAMQSDTRLERIVETLIQFGKGNFEVRVDVDETDEAYNAILSGLNMMGEELGCYKSQLKAKTELLEDIFDNISDAVYAILLHGDDITQSAHAFISPQAERLTGYSAAEIYARPAVWYGAIHPDDMQCLHDAAAKLKLGQTVTCQYRIIKKEGNEELWLEDRMVPKLNGAAPGKIQVFCSARDITAQKEAYESLAEANRLNEQIIAEKKAADEVVYSQQMLIENIFNNTPADLVVFDKNQKFLYISKQAIKNAELREWLIGRDNFDYCRYKGLDDTMAKARRVSFLHAVNTRGEAAWIDEHTAAGGEKVYMLRKFYPHFENDELQYVCGYGTNITQLKNAEQDKEKLIIALNDRYNELEQFNYIVSHNLRAPVSTIMGAGGLLKTELNEEDRTELNDCMVKAAEFIDVLLQDLNTVLSAKSLLNKTVEEFKLSGLIAQVQTHFAQGLTNARAIVNVSVTDGSDMITSIRSYVQSALCSLVSNAIKYKRAGVPPQISITVTGDAAAHYIAVKDNGIGIDMQRYGGELFMLYKRFHTGYEGKGLGLHLAKTQIESLGGKITAESVLGEGSVFTIVLKQ